MSLAVANRYARALADVVLAPGSGVEPLGALDQLRTFRDMMLESPELKNVLISPAVSVGNKRSVVSRLGDRAGFASIIRNFLYVVIDHRRVDQIPDLVSAFEAALDERTGRVRAHVTSAAPLDPGQQTAVQERLARLTGKQVHCEFRVEAGLIGGLVARIGSTVYDGSVRGQLEVLRQRLIPA
jgi:F-type H+-transporting ATPase subunit delta